MNLEEILGAIDFTSVYWQAGMTLIFMIADIVTGLMQAFINHNLDSQVMREGIIRKMVLIVVIILSFVAQFAFDIPQISKIVCLYLIFMEVLSILENIKKAGIDLGKLGELIKDKVDINKEEK